MSAILNKLIDWSKVINTQLDKLLVGAQKTDVWFIGVFILATVFSALIFKRRRMILLALSVYVVTALYQALPFDWAIKFGNNIWIFFGAVIAIFLLLANTVGKGYNSLEFSGRIKSLLFSFVVLGFLVSSALNFVTDVDILSNIGLVNKLFSGEISRAIWAGLPLLGFIILR